MTEPLVVTRVHGDHLVHLVPENGQRTLCAMTKRMLPPTRSFREAGCPRCLQRALEAGHVAASEGGRSFINLARMSAPAARGG